MRAAPPAYAEYKVSQNLNSLPEVAFHSADYAGESRLLPTKILPIGNSTLLTIAATLLATDPGLSNDQRLILRHAGPFVLNTVRKALYALPLSFSTYATACASVGINKNSTPHSVASAHPNSSASIAAGSGSIPVDVVAGNSAALKSGNRPNTFALGGLTSADGATRPAECESVCALFKGGE